MNVLAAVMVMSTICLGLRLVLQRWFFLETPIWLEQITYVISIPIFIVFFCAALLLSPKVGFKVFYLLKWGQQNQKEGFNGGDRGEGSEDKNAKGYVA